MKSNEIGVIFDCDGTLLDSMGMWLEMQKQLIEKSNGALTMADLAELNACDVASYAKAFHERFHIGKSANDVLNWISDFAINFYETKAKLRPGVANLLDGLAKQGVHMSVATASPHSFIDQALKNNNIMQQFDAVLSVEDVDKTKEDPAIYVRAQEIMGTNIETTWGVEDSVYALKTLNAAGFKTLAIYDNDLCGTWQELTGNSTQAIRSFEEISAEKFISWN